MPQFLSRLQVLALKRTNNSYVWLRRVGFSLRPRASSDAIPEGRRDHAKAIDQGVLLDQERIPWEHARIETYGVAVAEPV